jgi:S1-C subfamily serine protease
LFKSGNLLPQIHVTVAIYGASGIAKRFLAIVHIKKTDKHRAIPKMDTRKTSRINSIALTACVMAALAVSGCATRTNIGTGERSVRIEGDATPASAVLNSSMNGLLKQTSPSYVTLIVTENDKRSENKRDETLPKALTSGSGFVVDPSGYVLTAGHVAVKAGNTVDARSNDGRLYQGKVIAIQRSPDIALIKLNGFAGLAVKPASSVCITRGAAVFSLGKPHSKGDTARIGELQSMSFGRPVSYNGFGYPDAMVLRMGTQKGESGGPVFNQQGQLSGMMVSTLSDGKGHSLNLAHALPVNMLAKFACSRFSCSSAWRNLTARSHRSCS